jgi:hypothetical protein
MDRTVALLPSAKHVTTHIPLRFRAMVFLRSTSSPGKMLALIFKIKNY